MEELLQEYPILQSGFVGINDKYLTLPSNEEFPLFKKVTNQVQPKNYFHYSEAITNYYHDYVRDNSLADKFSFIDDVMTAFSRIIPINTAVEDWLKLQSTSDYYSETHNVFLIESLEYLFNSKPRDVSPQHYISLLTTTSNNSHADISPKLLDMCKSTLHNTIKWKDVLHNVLIGDAAKRRDFIVTCFVLFGKRN